MGIFIMTAWPSHALQRTRPSRSGCNRAPSWAGSLSWVVTPLDYALEIRSSTTMKIITAILAVLPMMATTCLAGILAGPITNPTNGHIYYLLSQNTWTASQAEAVQLGGNLATINNQAEQDWVYQTFSGTNRSLWIGLADQNNVGFFRWANGEPVGYSNWAPGEPSFGLERWVNMVLPGFPHSGKWNNENNVSFHLANGAPVPLHGVVEVVPTVLSIQVACVQASWNTETNRSYQLQYSSALTTNTWVNLGAPVAGTGTYASVIDTILGEPQRFYRVLPLPQ